MIEKEKINQEKMNQEKMNTLQYNLIQTYPNLPIHIIENAIRIWTTKSLFSTPEKSIQNLINRTKENEDVTREYLTKKYPQLPFYIIESSIETCTLHSLAPISGTISMDRWMTAYKTVCVSEKKLPQMYNTYNSQVVFETFAEMASNLVKEKISKIIFMLLLQHKKTTKESGKGIFCLPSGIFLMILNSFHTMLLKT